MDGSSSSSWPREAESAIAADRLADLDRLLARPDARPDARVSGGCGLAQVAAHWGRLDHLRRLRSAGCPMQLPDNDGDTALTEAATLGHLDTVAFLLDCDGDGVDIDLRNRAGCTALHAACERKHLPVARLLLDRGASASVLDEAGNSALHSLAARLPQQTARPERPPGAADAASIAQLMRHLVVKLGVRPDLENWQGYTAAMKCVATGHWSLLPHLLGAAAEPGTHAAAAASRHGVNLAHVFHAHHDDSAGARAAARLLRRCLGDDRWAAMCAARVASGPYAGYTCLHFACEFCRVGWLPGLLAASSASSSTERTGRGESAVDILARRRQLGQLRQRCGAADATVWLRLLLLLDPLLGAPCQLTEARLARARRLLRPLCDNEEHDSGRLFQPPGGRGGSGGSYESGRRYWLTCGQDNRQYPLALKLLTAAIGEDSPEAFASLLELGHLDGCVWSVEFGRDLHRYLASAGGGAAALPAIGNGFAQLRPEHLAGIDSLDPLDLAVALGRSRVVQEMLLTRPFDLIPACLRVLLACRRMRRVRHRCVNDMRDCAQAVLVNALNCLHDGTASEKDKHRIDAYVHGELAGATSGPVFAADVPLPVVREADPTGSATAPAKVELTVLQLLLASGCEEALSTRCVRMLVKRRWAAARARCLACGRRGLSPSAKFALHVASLAVFTALLTAFLATGGRRVDRDDSNSTDWHSAGLALLTVFAADHLVLGCRVLHCARHRWPDFSGAWRGAELLLPAMLQLVSLLGLAFVGTTGLGGGEVDSPVSYYLHLTLAASYLLLSIRWLYNLTVFRLTGPTVSILKTLIMDDLVPFLSIFGLVTVAFGVFFHAALHPRGRQFRVSDGQPAAMRPIESLVEIYSRPLLLAFGEFQIDSLRPCEQRADSNCSDLAGTDCLCPHQDGLRLYLALFVHLYLFVNLALVNLLIAKFSLTVNTKVEQAFVIWNKHRMRMLCEYQILPTLPPPFSGLNLAFTRLLASGCLACRRGCDSSTAAAHSVARQSAPSDGAKRLSWSHWESFATCRPYLKYLWLQASKFRNRRRLFLRKVKFEADGSVRYIPQSV